MEEQGGKSLFSTPTGPRRERFFDLGAGLLGPSMAALNMAAAGDPTLQWTRQQTALGQALEGLGGQGQVGVTTGRVSVATAGDVNGSLKTPAEVMWLIQGARGAPADAQVKLLRFDASGPPPFAGGL